MARAVPNRKWPKVTDASAEQIKDRLLRNGGLEDEKLTSPYEAWRIRYSDATFILYKNGTLYVTDSNDGSLVEAHTFIDSLVESRFVKSRKQFLIGFDETGKGEVLGHTVLVGVLIPNELHRELELAIGMADSKTRRTLASWQELLKRIDAFRTKGLYWQLETIPPWEVDRHNINKLLDITYQRTLLAFAQSVELSTCRIVLDNYGIGGSLERFLRAVERAGAEVVVTTKADETYLESRTASLIAKHRQQLVLAAIAKNPEFRVGEKKIGSGNAGDPETLGWLKAWHASGRAWPWFVKQSFKTVQGIQGRTSAPKKEVPPINDHLLSDEFRKRWENGQLSIRSLAIICPSCGSASKSVKLAPLQGVTTALCVNPKCQRQIPNLTMTIRYYCGRVLPDTSVITRGFLSKDLENARFFENFTVFIDPVVKGESDTPGGKKELERLGHFASIGRIQLEETGSLLDPKDLENIQRDEAIQIAAEKTNSLLITADNGMKGSAQAKRLFVLEL